MTEPISQTHFWMGGILSELVLRVQCMGRKHNSESHGPIIRAYKFILDIRSISKPNASKAKICNFLNHCEIRGGMGKIAESVHVFRPIVYAPNACFAGLVPICCLVS